MTENKDVNLNPLNKEIAHAAVLPPSWYEAPPGETAPSHAGKVIFWNRKKGMDWDPAYPTWRWDPNRPQALMPSWPVSGDTSTDPFLGDDIFCSGMAFLPSGDLITVGGCHGPSGGTGTPEGIDNVFILRVSGGGLAGWDGHPYWQHEVSAGTTPDPFTLMDRARYYPAAITLPSGSVLGLGGISFQGRSRQIFNNAWDAVTGEFVEDGFELFTVRDNHLIEDAANPPPVCTEPKINLHDYGKLAVLKDGRVMQMDGEIHQLLPADGEYHVAFFNDPEAVGVCSTEPGNPRWTMGVPDDTDDPYLPTTEPIAPVMFGGSGAYLITRSDPANTSAETTDVAYIMGGTVHGNDDAQCPGVNVPITDVAKKMVAPSEVALWNQDDVPPMNRQRLNAVATILLDGSILMTGGTSKPDPAGNDDSCTFAMRPERYRPPEVFHDASLDILENPWRLMAKAAHRRTYHNVAGLLPDGRVFVAGSQHGQKVTDEHDSRYSVELFSPPYMFVGPRPEILNPPGETVFMGDAAEIKVRLGSSDREIERIAMIRNSATTHAYDMSQRYVELKITDEIVQDPQDPLVWTVPVVWPGTDVVGQESQDVMVPGWHLLTVVDTPIDPDPLWDCGDAEPASILCTQRPSEAVWVQLFPPTAGP